MIAKVMIILVHKGAYKVRSRKDSYIFFGVHKIPTDSNLRNEGFILTHSFTVQSIMMKASW